VCNSPPRDPDRDGDRNDDKGVGDTAGSTGIRRCARYVSRPDEEHAAKQQQNEIIETRTAVVEIKRGRRLLRASCAGSETERTASLNRKAGSLSTPLSTSTLQMSRQTHFP